MAGKAKPTAPNQPEAQQSEQPAVVRRFRRFGRADELGVVIASGWIDVEELADGTFRIAEGDLPLFEPDDSAPATESEASSEAVPADTSPDAASEPSAPAEAPPAQE